jgi:acylglycerol lipase
VLPGMSRLARTKADCFVIASHTMNAGLPRIIVTALLLAGMAACAQPSVQSNAGKTQAPLLDIDVAMMADGYRLPVTTWRAQGEPRAVLLALHGFNDYRNAFQDPAAYFAKHGISTVAYDQRGFGETEQRGIWPNQDSLSQDALTMARLLCNSYPGLPLFVLGESMGGAVLIEALRNEQPECHAGTILVAPAVWGWQTMPWWQSLALNIVTHLMPATTLTGEGLGITPSDNTGMLRALAKDPLVIKATRVDALYGVTNLMSAAFENSAALKAPVLLLYGERDEIIPPEALCRLTVPATWRMVLYPDGYHMLLRDLQAQVVLHDIVSWIADRQLALPSGHDGAAASTGLQQLCANL